MHSSQSTPSKVNNLAVNPWEHIKLTTDFEEVWPAPPPEFSETRKNTVTKLSTSKSNSTQAPPMSMRNNPNSSQKLIVKVPTERSQSDRRENRNITNTSNDLEMYRPSRQFIRAAPSKDSLKGTCV